MTVKELQVMANDAETRLGLLAGFSRNDIA
jgi:hypothetical protein